MTGLETVGMIVWICLLFVPVVLLLCTGWFFVRWQNEQEDEPLKARDKKRCQMLLAATVTAVVVFFVLHLIFPLPMT